MVKNEYKNSEQVINELRERIVDVNYSSDMSVKKNKINPEKIWKLAKKVSKSLNEDSIRSANPA